MGWDEVRWDEWHGMGCEEVGCSLMSWDGML